MATPDPPAGEHTIVFTFDRDVTAGTPAVTAGTATVGNPTIAGGDISVPLTGVGNAQYVTVSLTDVNSSDGGAGGSGSVRVGFLVGDVNGSRAVTLADVLTVNAVLAQPVSASNFVRDLNLSGALTLADVLLVNSRLTQALPPPLP